MYAHKLYLHNVLYSHNSIIPIVLNPSIDGLSNGLNQYNKENTYEFDRQESFDVNTSNCQIPSYKEIERICYLCNQKCGLKCVECLKFICSRCSEFQFEKDYKDVKTLCNECYNK